MTLKAATLLLLSAAALPALDNARLLAVPKLGEAAPRIGLPDRPEGPVLLVFPPSGDASGAAAQSARAAQPRIEAQHGALILADSTAREMGRAYLRAGAADRGRAILFLIDRAGIVRRMALAGRPESTGSDLLDMLDTFAAGKLAFESACARCHGDDGKDGGYLYIKRLGGIGNRLTEDQIRERIRPLPMPGGQFSVRATLFSRRNLEALVLYVAGL